MRLVAIFPGALGDLCLLAPALAGARATGAVVALSVQRSLEPVARMLVPDVELGPPVDGRAMGSLFGSARDPTLARWLEGAAIVHAWLARAADADAVAASLATCGARVELHAVPRGDEGRHANEDYATALAVPAAMPRALVAIAPPPAGALPWRAPASARLVVHPGAGARAKVWAREGFRRVADEWRCGGGEVAIVLGPAEEAEVDAWTAAGHVPIVGSIMDAAALLASAPTFLGNDSGISHLAGALGRRGVVLFGPTRPDRWRPRGGRLDVVSFAGRAVDDVRRDVVALLGAPVP